MSDLRAARWLKTFLTYGLSYLVVIHRLWVGLLANACTGLARFVFNFCLGGMCIGSWEKSIYFNESRTEPKIHYIKHRLDSDHRIGWGTSPCVLDVVDWNEASALALDFLRRCWPIQVVIFLSLACRAVISLLAFWLSSSRQRSTANSTVYLLRRVGIANCCRGERDLFKQEWRK